MHSMITNCFVPGVTATRAARPTVSAHTGPCSPPITATAGRNVLIVEDILDTGKTLHQLIGMLKQRNPASLKICVLLDKPARREEDIHADYVGYTIPDAFVVGYGLDYAEEYRNLPYIGVMSPSVYSHE